MRKLLFTFGTATLLLFSTGISQAGNAVYVAYPGDTIWTSISTPLEIYIENDFTLGGISLGLKLYSPDGATWTWGNPKVEIVSGSRMDGAFLPGDFNVVEYDTDGVMPDSLFIGGISESGIASGYLQSMLLLKGTAGPDQESIHTLCFDSAYMPSTGGFVFLDIDEISLTPDFVGGCWPTRALPCCCDAYFNVSFGNQDLYHCNQGSLSYSATSANGSAINFSLHSIVNGSGTAQVIDNGDGTGSVRYSPSQEDVGKEVLVEVSSSTSFYPLECDVYYAYFNVSGNPPIMDVGMNHDAVGINNLIIKNDIQSLDEDDCDQLYFSIISGPGQMDLNSGEYTWSTTPDDIGIHEIMVEVSDGSASVQFPFELTIINQESFPGNVNCNGSVDVGDAVHMINFVFKNGAKPLILNWADANGDCSANVGDAIYLVNYIFRDGPAPGPGCVE